MGKAIRIMEVGPRDGLQNDPQILPSALKANFIKRLADCGLKHIEVGSFVSPKWIPQMSDSTQVIKKIMTLKKTKQISKSVRFSRFSKLRR